MSHDQLNAVLKRNKKQWMALKDEPGLGGSLLTLLCLYSIHLFISRWKENCIKRKCHDNAKRVNGMKFKVFM